MSVLKSLVSGRVTIPDDGLPNISRVTSDHQKSITGRSVYLYYGNGHDTELPLVLGKPVSKVWCHVELKILLTLLRNEDCGNQSKMKHSTVFCVGYLCSMYF